MSRIYKELLEIAPTEDIVSDLLNDLSIENLNLFLKLLESYNRELENKLIKQNECVYFKKNNLECILRRMWLCIEEKDRKGMAPLFKNMEIFLSETF